MTSFLVQVSASTFAQFVTLKQNNITLKKVFSEIRKQTGYTVLYDPDAVEKAGTIDLDLVHTPLREALEKLLKGQNLEFSIEDKAIVIKHRAAPSFLDRVVDAFTPPVDVRGVVVDEKGMPLAGANVKVRGFKQAAVTDNEGRFYLPGVDDQAVLIVSFVGYKDVEVGVKASLSVALELKAAELNEVVVAYGKITQRALTGAVTVVKGEQIQSLPNRSFDKSLQGLVPGLLVTSGSGQPGSPPGNFLLRGIATGGQPTNGETFRNPLIVIDGIPVSQEPAASISGGVPRVTNPLSQINPSDIESISVLKDAAAIALYGAKASNGVILVTTKKGKAGNTIFSFRNQIDIASTLDGKIKMLNQQQYLELLYEAHRNSNPTFWTDARIDSSLKTKFPTRPDGSFYPQSDWSSALFHKAALTMSNELSISGGNDKSNFYLNLQYTKQDGAAKSTGFDQKSFRFNYENNVRSWFKIGSSSMLSYNIQKFANEASGSFLTAFGISPLNPIRDIEGDFIYKYAWGVGGSSSVPARANPVAQSELNVNNSTAYRAMTSLFGTIDFSKNINLRSTFGFDFMLNEVKSKEHPLVSFGGGAIVEQPFRTAAVINSNILQFSKNFNNQHSVSILMGQEAQIQTEKYTSINRAGFADNPDQNELLSGTIISATGNSSKRTLLSYFSQANYGFREKYYFSGSIRTDGSSNFGINNRFGTYWSVSGAWVVSGEEFMKKTNTWLNFLKIRGSMGPAGNSAAIADILRFDELQRVDFLNGIAVFPTPDFPGNPSIKWEQTFVWDAGVELHLLKDRVSLTADLYNRKTKNLISYNIPAPWATGSGTFTGNIGDIKNQGIELAFSASIIRQKNIKWNVSVNWSKNRNRLTRSALPEIFVTNTVNNLINKVGYEYNSFYLRKWAGVNPANGRPMWIDSLGKPNENFRAAKPEVVGKAQPDGFGGVNTSFGYKGVELSIGMYYQYGSQIYFTSQLQNDGSRLITDPYLNQSTNALDRWRKPGDIATNPRRLLNGTAGTEVDFGSYYSTRYLYDGDFIRLGNVQLAYSLPEDLLKTLYINSARIFIQGHNLATWTRYSGQDPENIGPSGFGSIIYPQSRSYSLGLNVNF